MSDAGTACTASVSCYSGAAGTSGVGACKPGTQQCVNGILGPCTGEVGPSAESCNGVDDDCNAAVDDALGTVSCGVGVCAATVNACTAGKPSACVAGTPAIEICANNIDDNCNGAIDDGCPCGAYVSPTGVDTALGSAVAPMRTITAAIAKVAAAGAGVPKSVCVASGANAPSTFDYAEAIAMKSGVSVFGGYITTPAATWSRQATAVTRVTAQNAKGVLFDATVVLPTTLDGFLLVGQSNVATSAAVTVEGSTGAVLVNNSINTPAGVASSGTSYGIDVLNSGTTKATPAITRNTINGGNGTQFSIGVHSLNSAPVISAQCPAGSIDATGRCTAPGCGNITAFIRGRITANSGTTSYGVFLESSPGAIVSQSAICGGPASTTGDSVGVLVKGDATGTQIRTSNIAANTAGKNSVGVWMDPCGGAAPWVFNNSNISGTSIVMGARGDGVRAVGACHPRIDSNLNIVGGQEQSNADTNGVFCAKDPVSGISSLCTVLGNVAILGSNSGFPPVSTGVHCDDGACARIENNVLISGRSGQTSIGISINNAGPFISNNIIESGCANGMTGIGVGLLSNNSFARVQNNVLGGVIPTANCAGNAPNSYGVLSRTSGSLNELDLHSNDIFGRGGIGAVCTSRAIGIEASPGGAASPRGIVRNNILHAGTCATSYGIEEASAMADPRLLQNNDFFGQMNGTSFGTALYRDEGATNVTAIASVNLLGDITAAANISSNPLFTSATNLHLQSGSPCRNTGTNVSCPTADPDGDAKPQENICDIGFDEFKP